MVGYKNRVSYPLNISFMEKYFLKKWLYHNHTDGGTNYMKTIPQL